MALVNDRDRLVAALRARGVDYLAPGDAAGPAVEDATLIASLAVHGDARLKQALSALFLVQPDLAPLVPEQPCAAAVELTARYQAAVYLRAMWATRRSHYLPAQPPLPDYFSEQLALPGPQRTSWPGRPGYAGCLARKHGRSAHQLPGGI